MSTANTSPLLGWTGERGGNSQETNLAVLCWNTVIVLVTAIVVNLSEDEITTVPIRLWLVGYVIHCVVHMYCVEKAYRRQRRSRSGIVPDDDDVWNTVAMFVGLANTIFIFIWWIIGFCWVVFGGRILANDAPKLFWLTTILLVLKSFSLVITLVMGCIVCIGGVAAISLASPA